MYLEVAGRNRPSDCTSGIHAPAVDRAVIETRLACPAGSRLLRHWHSTASRAAAGRHALIGSVKARLAQHIADDIEVSAAGGQIDR